MSITTMRFAARDFSARRGASDEHTLQGSVRSEQRSLAEKELPPEGLRRIWPGAALLVGHRSTLGYAPSSRLAPGQIGRNERHRSYVHDHLGKSAQHPPQFPFQIFGARQISRILFLQKTLRASYSLTCRLQVRVLCLTSCIA